MTATAMSRVSPSFDSLQGIVSALGSFLKAWKLNNEPTPICLAQNLIVDAEKAIEARCRDVRGSDQAVLDGVLRTFAESLNRAPREVAEARRENPDYVGALKFIDAKFRAAITGVCNGASITDLRTPGSSAGARNTGSMRA